MICCWVRTDTGKRRRLCVTAAAAAADDDCMTVTSSLSSMMLLLMLLMRRTTSITIMGWKCRAKMRNQWSQTIFFLLLLLWS